MNLPFLIEGFAVKFVASSDDVFTRLPLIAAVTGTRVGKVAFSVGNLIALAVVIAAASLLAPVMKALPYYHWFVAGLILVMAALVLRQAPARRANWCERLILRFRKRVVTPQRFLTLVLIGFTASIVTLIDDAVVFLPLFDHGRAAALYAVVGIFIATAIQLAAVILLAERLRQIPYQRQLIALALAAYAVLVAARVL